MDLRKERPIDRMTTVQKEFSGRALPEDEELLHKDPHAWRDALSQMYRDLCDDFQAKKAESIRIGNVVARNEYEAWKKQANVRKEALTKKLQYVNSLLRESSQDTNYWQKQFTLLTEIRDELRLLRMGES